MVKSEFAAYMREWRRKNPDKVKASAIKSEANPKRKEQKRLALAAWRKRNAQKHRDDSTRWRKENKQYVYFMNSQRRLKLRAIGSFTYNEWQRIKERYHFTCPCCLLAEPDITLRIDHIKPISKGGLNIAQNIQPLCQLCNSRKYTKEVKYAIPTGVL